MIDPFLYPFNDQFFWITANALNLSPIEERDDSLTTAQNSNHPSLCKECKLNRTHAQVVLCAPVVFLVLKLTKQHTRCTGKRQRTQFVPLAQFDDNLLLFGNFFSQICSFLSNFNTHLAILKIYHEWIGLWSPLRKFTGFFFLEILICFSILKMFSNGVL